MPNRGKRSFFGGIDSDFGFAKTKFLITVSSILTLVLAFFVFMVLTAGDRRDQTRTEDLRSVREALFAYYNENGYYPSSVSEWNTDKSDLGAGLMVGANDYDNLASLISHLVSELPTDPLNPANTPIVSEKYLYRYVSSANGQNFAIIYETEDRSDESPVIMKGW